jgi:predicted RNA-binding protein
MPQYWILSISEDNYFIAKTHGLIGITEHGKRVIYQMTLGDMITFYIPRKRVDSSPNNPTERVRKLRGLARVSGEAFASQESIWHARGGEIFPHRRRIEFLSDATTDGKPVLEELSYVTNTVYWALPLKNGYVSITKTDFDKIQEALGTQF